MLTVIPVSPADRGEVAVARRLQALIAREWPDLHEGDSVRILVGLRAHREIDLVVEINLARPRQLPARPGPDGSTPPSNFIQAAVLVVEVKQIDQERITCVGPQVFADYDRRASTNRSINTQLADQITGLNTWRKRYGVAPFFIHGMAWLTECPKSALEGVESNVLGAEATWCEMLAGVGGMNPSLFGGKAQAERDAIGKIVDILATPRGVTARDRRRVDALTNSMLNAGVIEAAKTQLGKKQISIVGRAGSGKSTALVLLADRVTRLEGERVLILTYHRALCNELQGLVRSLLGDASLRDGQVRIEPTADFIARAYELAFDPLLRDGGHLNYGDFLKKLEGIAADPVVLERLRAQAADLKEIDPQTFGFDYLFIDEAQDILDCERDFLRALYPPSSFVLADGLDQLVRRGERCNWNLGVPKGQRTVLELPRSLRMSANVAAFVNEVAIAAGLANWRIDAHPDLTGGRIIITVKDLSNDKAMFDRLIASAKESNAEPDDVLVLVGHQLVDQTRHSVVATNLRAWGYNAWDGANPAERDDPPVTSEAVRVVQYDSARGLEGWCAMLLGLDDFFEHRMKHPNVLCDTDAQRVAVARQWMLMSLARAAHILVISVRDKHSRVARWLLEAAAHLPRGVVETDLD
jgi:energy-coupling factor transporter ATP-binding protein EcfA2